jgi:hypothetical protein
MDVDAVLHSIVLSMEIIIFGPDLIDEVEGRVHRIQDNLKPRVIEGLANEGREEVWGDRKVSTSLHRTIPHP